jgi:peptide/nickel transport system substrate-binding protein
MLRPGGELKNLNPAAFAVDPQIALSYLEPLVRSHPATLKPEPWLAESWAWHADGKELSFQIRGGVAWHDGSALTAADAHFSFQVYREDTESAVAGLFSLVDSIEAPTEHELVVRFGDRDANWLFNVATLPIFSREQYEEYWSSLPDAERTLSGFDWTDSTPRGTGPWQVSDWSPANITYARNARYWRHPTWLDELSISIEPSPGVRAKQFEKGESQLIWPVRGSRLPELKVPPSTAYRVPAASVMFAAFNFANPNLGSGSYWTDLRVREAVSMAINRERYASDVFNDFVRWDVVGTVAQPWAHDDDLTAPAFNPERASVLLREAGWVDYNGDGVLEDVNGSPFSPTVIVQEAARPELIALLARVARDLVAVGIALTIESLSNDAFDRRWIVSRDYDLIAYAYDQLPGFTDFDLYGSEWDVRSNPAGWNPGGYSNPEADAAIGKFLEAVSIERQAEALKSLQRAVNEDLFGLWFGFPDDVVLVANEIDGFQPDMAWQTARTWDLWHADDR